ncbi:MAG: response regulator [Alphaproteobacteria bacterium]|nr:response regulator [Alphaproteobacteria bacterium]
MEPETQNLKQSEEPVILPDDSQKDVRAARAEDVQRALNVIYLGQLRTVAAVMAVYYLFLAVSHALVLPEDIRLPLALTSGITSALSLLLHFSVRWGRIPASQSHVAFLPPALAGIVLVFLHVELTSDSLQLTNGVLIMIAFGFITLNPWVFGLLIGLSAFLYALCLAGLAGPNTVHLGFLGLATVVLSILCFVQRYRTLSNIERLLITNRAKSQALSAKAKEARSLMFEANKAAEEATRANEAKSVFLANASHELRTPLTGVLGMMKLLEKSPLDTGQQELLGAAKFSAKTLLTLINDILDLARMEEGKLELKPRAFDPGVVVGQVAELLKPVADEKGLKLTVAVEQTGTITLTGDDVRIGQILFNLVGNAVKFTAKGYVTIGLVVEPVADDFMSLRFTVEDSGVGMEEAEIERLFGRFEQADGSSAKDQGGAGLGLAISQELAVLMGGEISAKSVPGQGSIFSFALTLPVDAGPVEKRTAANEESAPKITETPLRVLLAEDNKVNQMLITKLLSAYPWNVKVVADGEQAVQAAREEKFDLVLMDVRMPKLDGIEATKKILSVGESGDFPKIIALTANTMVEDIETYLAVGMDAVVGKPIQMAELLAVVERALDNDR